MAETPPDAPMAGTPVLFHTTPVPLFVDTENPGTYYWINCIGVALATVLLRLLIAVRPSLERRFWSEPSWPPSSEKGVVGGDGALVPLADDNDDDERGEDARLELEDAAEWRQGQRTPDAALRHGRGHHRHQHKTWPAVAAQRLGRAVFEVLVVGLGYLIMLAVMSMNVGYFLSVLAGVFLGTVLLGGQTTSPR